VIAYMAMLFGLSSFSTLPSLPEELSYYEAHIAAYAGLGLVSARALGKGLRAVSSGAVVGASLLAALYGVSDEYHQTFVPGRTFDRLDILADAVGSVLGATAAGAWSIISRRFSQQPR
jgi:VanZ family protein